MSVSPQQMQQMLAMYQQQFPNGQPQTPAQQQLQGLNQASAGLGAGAPAGTNKTAGGVNGAAQLMTALMKAQKMKQIQQQLNQAQVQQGMPQANANQQGAIQNMLQQNPVAPVDPSQMATPPVPGS